MPTKRIAARMRCSQQLVSYLIKRLKDNGHVSFTLQADTSRLGYEHIVVGIRYKRIIPARIRRIVETIRKAPQTTLVAEAKNGADLLLEFTSENLSAFSKQFHSLLKDESDLLDIEFMMPVIVRRSYPRSYLSRGKREAKILFGDRMMQPIEPLEEALLVQLQEDARMPLIELARRTDSSLQLVRSSISRLKEQGVMRGYTLAGDLGWAGIKTSWLFLSLPSEGLTSIDQVVSGAEGNPHVVGIIKLIGTYQIMLRIEEIDAEEVLRGLRTTFDIERSNIIEAVHIGLERPIPRGREKFS